MSGRWLRWLLLPALGIPVAWLLVASLGGSVPRVGDPAPEFSLVTLDGRTVSSADLAGRPYLLNFWASWCVPACVEEHPVLLEAHERFGDQVAVIGVLYRDSPEAARRFLQTYGDGGWPHLSDPGERLAGAWGVIGAPETFLVDAEGRVAARRVGPLTAGELDTFLQPVATVDR
ncbi:MAG TPA: redoxin family protein [Candidatus Limnocylindria bacterium]|nr:redoxin family protein [Candidatus Limnocylindria bacterium]